jgi:fumarylacetoacetate (FAA) hydrolase family protein
MSQPSVSVWQTLPIDRAGALAGRIWRPDVDGPSVVAVRGERLVDISRVFPTMRYLCETPARQRRKPT